MPRLKLKCGARNRVTELARSSNRLLQWRIITLTVFLVLAGTSISCRRANKAAEASLQVARELAGPVSSRSPSPGSTYEVNAQRVYLDSSISMAGYVRSNGGHTSFTNLIDELGRDMPYATLYKYGQIGSQPPKKVSSLLQTIAFDRRILQPSFYNRQFNPDDRLINMLAEEKKPVLSVLVTDGVYSDTTGAITSPVVQAIGHWMKSERVFGILIFRSPYKGPFYSELRRGMIPYVSTAARPFYAYVFSPNLLVFQNLRDKLAKRFKNMGVILFSPDALNCQVHMPEGVPGMYSYEQPPDRSFYWEMFNQSIFGRANQATLKYKFGCTMPSDFPVASLNINVVPQYYRYSSGGFHEVRGGPPDGYNYGSRKLNDLSGSRSKTAESRFTDVISIEIPRDPSTGYSLYAFKVHTSVNSLREDIRNLSTRDDSLPQNAGKTYRFYGFVSAVADVYFRDQLARNNSPWLFLTISNH